VPVLCVTWKKIPKGKFQVPNSKFQIIPNSEILDDFIPIYFPEENVLIGASS
jgi:hypothetical protein